MRIQSPVVRHVAVVLFAFFGIAAAFAGGDALLGREPYTRVGDIRVYRDFAYGPRPDAPGEGTTFKGQTWKDGKGNPVHTHRTGQLFDLWLPSSAPGTVPTDMLGRWVVLLGRLSGTDVFSAYQSGGEAAVDAVLRRWSPRWHVTSRMPPCILAYNKLHPFASSDGLVDIDNCDAQESALKEAGVSCASRVSWFCHHGKLKDFCQDWIVDQALSFK